MKNLKTIYFVLLLFIFLILGIIIVLPELIPSLEMVQVIVLGIIYLINIVLVYILMIRLWNYLQNVFDKTRTIILTAVVASIVAIGLLICFIITSLGVGQGFMGGTLYKEINFPEHNVTLFLYDDGFLDPLTTFKIRNKTFPTMKTFFYIENCQPIDLKMWRHKDILEFSSTDIVVKIDLKTREAKKTYINK